MRSLLRFFSQLLLGQQHARPTDLKQSELEEQWLSIQIAWNNRHHRDFGLERITRLFLLFSQYLFPGLYLKHLFGRFGTLQKKLAVEAYVIFKTLLPFTVLYHGWYAHGLFARVSMYMILETILYLATLIFFTHDRRAPQSYRRSLTTLVFNYIQIVLDYSVIYAVAVSANPNFFNVSNVSPMQIIYFSFVTTTTVGFGDLVPLTSTGQVLVISQMFLFFLFAALFFNFFLSKVREQTF